MLSTIRKRLEILEGDIFLGTEGFSLRREGRYPDNKSRESSDTAVMEELYILAKIGKCFFA